MNSLRSSKQTAIVLDNPIDIPTVLRYLSEGRTLIADVIGYRSDLQVVTVENGLVVMKATRGSPIWD